MFYPQSYSNFGIFWLANNGVFSYMVVDTFTSFALLPFFTWNCFALYATVARTKSYGIDFSYGN
jgi:hypothetical protein